MRGIPRHKGASCMPCTHPPQRWHGPTPGRCVRAWVAALWRRRLDLATPRETHRSFTGLQPRGGTARRARNRGAGAGHVNSLFHRCNNVLPHGTRLQQSAAAHARNVCEAGWLRQRRQRRQRGGMPQRRAMVDACRIRAHDPAHHGGLETRRLCRFATPLQSGCVGGRGRSGSREATGPGHHAAVRAGLVAAPGASGRSRPAVRNARRPGFAPGSGAAPRAGVRAGSAQPSYFRYLNRGSSGVPSSGLSGSLPGCQPITSSILRASAKSLSVTPLAAWFTSLTMTKA